MSARLGSRQIRIMGVLNCTPDSFYPDSRVSEPHSGLNRALQMIAAGADMIDIGAESTRPGAKAVSSGQQLEAILPLIVLLRRSSTIPISIDTSDPEVMQAAVEAGADFINDVRALQCPGALAIAAKLQVPVCLMHMQGEPDTMQHAPHYDDLIDEINDFFAERIAECEQGGIRPGNIIIDPGFGFGKTVEHNVALVQNLHRFKLHGKPILLGVSRKSSIGKIVNRETSERLAGSLALSQIAVQNGVDILRTHDVAACKDMLQIVSTCASSCESNPFEV